MNKFQKLNIIIGLDTIETIHFSLLSMNSEKTYEYIATSMIHSYQKQIQARIGDIFGLG